MRIKVPKMHWTDYLEIAGGLKKDPRFVLSNQDIENGYVKFRSEKRLRLLTEILEYHNTGRLPVSTIKMKAMTDAKMKKMGFEFEAFIQSLPNPKGPDGNGFYQTRCPSCAKTGGDTGEDHLCYTMDGVIHCYAGCKFFDIVDGYYKKEEKK